jgi:DNA-binding NarL/FixJ family response regulator
VQASLEVEETWKIAVRATEMQHGQSVTAVPSEDRDITVLLVDDQARFREALRDLISCARGFALVGEACSGEEATRAVTTLAPQLVLMDVSMPGMGGIAAARAILRRPGAPLVVLISVDDETAHPEVVSLGAAVAFVRKQDLRSSRLLELWEARPG